MLIRLMSDSHNLQVVEGLAWPVHVAIAALAGRHYFARLFDVLVCRILKSELAAFASDSAAHRSFKARNTNTRFGDNQSKRRHSFFIHHFQLEFTLLDKDGGQGVFKVAPQ
jgi:hypothetical protein